MEMASLKVRLLGDPCLREKAERVPEIGIAERMLIQAMIKTMYDQKGVGLAAPQVGINQQIFVADIGDGPFAVINPEIIEKVGPYESMEEGCLCVPDVQVKVKRPQKITVQYMSENNQMERKELSDFLARVFMHETDHLHGKLIVDYANWFQKKKIKRQIDKIMKSSQAES